MRPYAGAGDVTECNTRIASNREVHHGNRHRSPENPRGPLEQVRPPGEVDGPHENLLHDGGPRRGDRQARIRVRPHELFGRRLVARHASVRGLIRQAPHRGTAMVATAPPEGLLASETEPPWALAASDAAWRPSP